MGLDCLQCVRTVFVSEAGDQSNRNPRGGEEMRRWIYMNENQTYWLVLKNRFILDETLSVRKRGSEARGKQLLISCVDSEMCVNREFIFSKKALGI